MVYELLDVVDLGALLRLSMLFQALILAAMAVQEPPRKGESFGIAFEDFSQLCGFQTD